MNKLIVITIAILVLVTACTAKTPSPINIVSSYPPSSMTLTPLPDLTSPPSSTPTLTVSDYCEQLGVNYQPTDGYQAYCDEDYGFAFDYPGGWRITYVAGSPHTNDPIQVLKAQRFEAADMSNYIRVDTFQRSNDISLLDEVQHFIGYDDREFPNNEYPSLTLGGQRAYAIMKCWQQDYSAVYLFFQHGLYYTIMELKTINQEGLDTNWRIAQSLQTTGSTPDQNVIPQELINDSNHLIECNAPTTTPLPPLLPTWTVTPEGASDLELARHTLLTFFTLLHGGRYAEAVPLYGGSYEAMRSNNPQIPAEDYAGLWEASCTIQRPCLLVANIVEEEMVSQDEYRFLLEFVWIDGTLFKLGPCCGATETEMPTVWQFTYTVKKIDGQFKVMEEPVFIP